MPARVTVKCLTCSTPFEARVADRRRGWGRFCSKSCKAIKQTQITGRGRPRAYEDDSMEDNNLEDFF